MSAGCTIEEGTSFFADLKGGANLHLYIVCAFTQDNKKALLLNITTSNGGKYALTLYHEDHPWIKPNHPSDVNYADADEMDVDDIESNLRYGQFQKEPNCPDATLRKIVNFGRTTIALSSEFKRKYLGVVPTNRRSIFA